MDPLILLVILISFFSTFLILPIWIKKAKQVGLVWEDMHKKNHPKNVAGSGGITVVWGVILGILAYIALITFYFKSDGHLIEIFSLLTCLLLVAGIALIDDLFGWRTGGMSRRSRLILVFFSALPFVVINAGDSTMLGIHFGLIYPLIIIPLGIVGATTTFNFLAGYNGLEASQGILLLSGLSIATYITGNSWLSMICLCAVASLFAFYIFNMHPARTFPGDVLTYFVGALVAIVAILGDIERIALLFFIPYVLEVILKLRGKLKKESFAKLNSDGSLDMPYNKIYGLEHLAIFILKKIKPNKKVYEREVVFLINGFQILVILLSFLTLFL
jgi:UDP-N-acetylglucosamine--dolichyl-phosphate N-acetylglucosaminephosphotransferase